jgi:hypothetical protein
MVKPQKTTKKANAEMLKVLPDRLRELTRPTMTQIAPGKFVPHQTEEPPEVSLCHWQANGDGTFSALPSSERWVRVNQKLMRLIGFDGQWCTVTRLARGGYLEIINIAPHCTMLNLTSWFGHLRRCAENPEFWDKGGENYRHYVKHMF